MSHRVMIATIGIGGWYPRGVARMIDAFHRVSPGFEIRAWVNTYPATASGPVVVEGYDYGPYVAKSVVLEELMIEGVDIAILLDAAFYPIRPIHPLIEHIAQNGYYFCRNGARAGEWCSDQALSCLGYSRSQALQIEEISSYCVGLNFTDERCKELAQQWAGSAPAIPGPHTNSEHESEIGRNVGFCSKHKKVKGHRHDQTTLSMLAYKLGMHNLTERPKFTAYLGSETEETVLVNHGGI